MWSSWYFDLSFCLIWWYVPQKWTQPKTLGVHKPFPGWSIEDEFTIATSVNKPYRNCHVCAIKQWNKTLSVLFLLRQSRYFATLLFSVILVSSNTIGRCFTQIAFCWCFSVSWRISITLFGSGDDDDELFAWYPSRSFDDRFTDGFLCLLHLQKHTVNYYSGQKCFCSEPWVI